MIEKGHRKNEKKTTVVVNDLFRVNFKFGNELSHTPTSE